ncbi:sortase [uncultured Anaerococcus sp.]|uniref:sortase n=1 Tax=uncultured Anaerococcus sp. TaxID=293428 RepID=UPI0028894870|nr:sortase [uncultured Anaerococcus sp.]
MLRKNIYFYFGGACILLAFLCLTHNLREDHEAKVRTQKIVTELKEKVGKNSSPQNNYIENPKMEMPTRQINGLAYIGYLRIERLSLDLPILSEWSYPLIRISPARYRGSVYENNMIILAHNYKAHFGNLHRLDKGDKVEFVDMNDNHFIYEVEDVGKLRPEQASDLVEGNRDLSLFTCTLGGRERVVVRCKRQRQTLPQISS